MLTFSDGWVGDWTTLLSVNVLYPVCVSVCKLSLVQNLGKVISAQLHTSNRGIIPYQQHSSIPTWYSSHLSFLLYFFRAYSHPLPGSVMISVKSLQHWPQPLALRISLGIDLLVVPGVLDQSPLGRMNKMCKVPRLTSSSDSSWCRVRPGSLSSCNVIDQIDVGFILENEFSLSK
jgi:hypothetical protein